MKMALPMLLLEFMDDDDDVATYAVTNSCFSESNTAMIAAVVATSADTRPSEVLSGAVPGFFSSVIPTYSMDTFKSHFRMARSTFEILCRELAVVMPRSERELRVPLEEKAAMAVWTIANQETFREISNLFGMNRGNAHFCIFQVLKVISLQLKPEYVKWPSAIESRRIAAEFEESYGLAGVIGCLDGTHVQVKPPANDRDSYINRKGFPSINVMAVCDNSKTFRYVYADRAGSVHDARVLRVSSLGDMLENGTVYLSEDKENYHLLGDSAYPLLPNLIVPYRDNGHLTATQVRFNNIHSSTRSVIERAFGRLKGMFRRLRGVDCTHPMNALYMIEAAFVMHNFILYHEHGSDDDDIDNDVDGSDVPETSPATTSEFGTAAVRQAAREKRDKLAASL